MGGTATSVSRQPIVCVVVLVRGSSQQEISRTHYLPCFSVGGNDGAECLELGLVCVVKRRTFAVGFAFTTPTHFFLRCFSSRRAAVDVYQDEASFIKTRRLVFYQGEAP